ncbi:phage major capsid protein [Rhodoferax sp. WC2427]|uniref:phage major capsid family protein n=1 Tax=Rhodoferax sp. WC2427 TaxID=3234144 RepID=UPI0034678CD2
MTNQNGGMLLGFEAANNHFFKASIVKTSNLSRLAICLAIASLSVAAQAFGLDLHGFAMQHTDLLAGLSMMCVGDLTLIGKSLDKIETGLRESKSIQTELADRVLQLEQKGGEILTGDYIQKSVSLGDQFLKAFDANKELFAKTRSVRLEIKAASDALTTANGRTVVSGGVGGPTGGLLGLQNALSVRPAPGTSAIEYSRFTGTQGAAAIQAAEGAAKAAVRPDFTLITQSAITVAGFSKISRQAMSDSAELKRAVDINLARSVNAALDVALATGGTGFVGGFISLATPNYVTDFNMLVDAISDEVATMQLAGFNPDVVVLHPREWLRACVATSSTNEYLSGSYLGLLPSMLRGLRVVLSANIPIRKALVVDSAHAELMVVDDFSVEVSYVGDDFTNNLCTILGEMRVIPVFRTVGSMRLTSSVGG